MAEDSKYVGFDAYKKLIDRDDYYREGLAINRRLAFLLLPFAWIASALFVSSSRGEGAVPLVSITNTSPYRAGERQSSSARTTTNWVPSCK